MSRTKKDTILKQQRRITARFTETEYARRLRRQLERALAGQREARQPDPAELRLTEELLEDMKDAYGW